MNLNSARKRWRLVFWSHGGTCRRMEIFGLLFFPNFMEANKGCGEKWRGKKWEKDESWSWRVFFVDTGLLRRHFSLVCAGKCATFPIIPLARGQDGKKDRKGQKIEIWHKDIE